MAALFLVLAVVDAVLLGDAVIANTSASAVSVFNYSVTGFTQGQLLLIAAGLGLLGALLLGLAWRSSGARRSTTRRLSCVGLPAGPRYVRQLPLPASSTDVPLRGRPGPRQDPEVP